VSDPLRIEKLGPKHSLDGFDCGREELNQFLMRFALVNQRAGAAQTYVAVSDESVVGYYSLAVGEIAFDEAPTRLKKGLARHPVPIMLLARLAVRTTWQGRGHAERRDEANTPSRRYRRNTSIRSSRDG
jgi:hypothetical protein